MSTTAVLIIFRVPVMVGYLLVLETATRGQPLGKITTGLRVVSDDGSLEHFRQALFRVLASVVETWMLLGSPEVICSMLSPKAKRVGDIFASTVVISERSLGSVLRRLCHRHWRGGRRRCSWQASTLGRPSSHTNSFS